MSTGFFEQLETAFDHAASLDPPSRSAYFAGLQLESPRVAARLEMMFRADVQAVDEWLRSAAGALSEDGNTQYPRIPRYRVLGELGEGGFGVVYLAEQPRPVHRFVAVKLIKPGMDTRTVLARFRDESQAMALMDHPAVVGALEAGETELGRPYIVMPLVTGLPINAFAEQEKSPLRERVEMMVEVCRGVQHAHARGVMHRDLKPGNILVSRPGATPEVKIIDFGLAKALSSPLTPHSTVTLNGQMVGTPEYMSPEQAAERPLDIRTDVYSLGAVLYELVAGRPPFTAAELRSGNREDLRQLLERRVPAPPSRFAPMPRELDWICLRCLEKDPARRYPTADSLADDLNAFLRRERVRAGPPARIYRARVWLQRHRGAFAIAAAAAVALVAATAISVSAAARERAARDNADQSIAILKGMFAGLNPAEAQGKDRTLLVLMLRNLENVVPSLTERPEALANVLAVLGSGYATIGEYKKAYPLLRQSHDLHRDVYGTSDPRSVEAFRQWLEVEQRSVTVRSQEWFREQAIKLDSDMRLSLTPGSRAWIETQLTTCPLLQPDNYIDSFNRFQALITESERTLGASDRMTLRVMRRAARFADSDFIWGWGLETALEARQRAIDAYGVEDADAETGLATESVFIERVFGTNAAIDFIRQRLPDAERVLGPLNPSVFAARYNLGTMLLGRGDLAEAESYLTSSRELALRKHGEQGWADWVDACLLTLYLKQGRIDKARAVESRLLEGTFRGMSLSADLWVSILHELDQSGRCEPFNSFVAFVRETEPGSAIRIETDALSR